MTLTHSKRKLSPFKKGFTFKRVRKIPSYSGGMKKSIFKRNHNLFNPLKLLSPKRSTIRFRST